MDYNQLANFDLRDLDAEMEVPVANQRRPRNAAPVRRLGKNAAAVRAIPPWT